MLNVLVYCDERYQDVSLKIGGTPSTLLVSPPVRDADIHVYVSVFEQAELIVFNFHALPGLEAWVNTHGHPAMTGDTLKRMNLSRAVVFMVNCNSGGGMLPALKASRPRAIIGGEDENFGGVTELAGADVLGLWVRRGLQFKLSPSQALTFGKLRLATMPQTRSVRDAHAFRLL